MTEVMARVRRGAALLDQVVPDWRTMVDTDSLIMADTERCILGQVFGSYPTGIVRCGLAGEASKVHDHGFLEQFPYQSMSLDDIEKWRERYRTLGDVWQSLIQAEATG